MMDSVFHNADSFHVLDLFMLRNLAIVRYLTDIFHQLNTRT